MMFQDCFVQLIFSNIFYNVWLLKGIQYENCVSCPTVCFQNVHISHVVTSAQSDIEYSM